MTVLNVQVQKCVAQSWVEELHQKQETEVSRPTFHSRMLQNIILFSNVPEHSCVSPAQRGCSLHDGIDQHNDTN